MTNDRKKEREIEYMRKKYLATAAILATVSVLAACGGKNDTPNDEPTKAPTATEAPTATPTEAPAVDVSTQIGEIYEAIKAVYGDNYIPSMRIDNEAEYLQGTYGLDPSWYDYLIGEISMVSVNVDTLLIIHPTEGNLENVQNAMKTYQDYLINDSRQYPMNLLKVQGCQYETVGDYVIFVMLSNDNDMSEEISEDQEAAVIQSHQEQNQAGIAAAKKLLGIE